MGGGGEGRRRKSDGENEARRRGARGGGGGGGEGFRGGTRSQAVYINLAPTIHIQVGIHTLSEAARLVE